MDLLILSNALISFVVQVKSFELLDGFYNTNLSSQAFYMFRLWRVSQKTVIPAILFACIVGKLVVALVVTARAFGNKSLAIYFLHTQWLITANWLVGKLFAALETT
jgi:hypothetical protein